MNNQDASDVETITTADVVAIEAPVIEESLPAGWIEGFDPHSSKQSNFYYNTVTGHAQWEVPTYAAWENPSVMSIEQIKRSQIEEQQQPQQQSENISRAVPTSKPPCVPETQPPIQPIKQNQIRQPLSSTISSNKTIKQRPPIDFKKKLQDLEQSELRTSKKSSLFTSYRRR
mmetsp:Transcript_4948/g.7453  ORF Transcript_4948/g.7453 Transcript_4948/m.7453 type:complete len:172 (-) Transcript_4948:299-814(-)